MRPFRAVLPHNRKENLLERCLAAHLAGNARAQFFQRTLRHKPAFVNDGDMAAKPLDDFQYMGSQENGRPTLGHPAEQSLQSARRESIDAFEGFVQKHSPWPMD